MKKYNLRSFVSLGLVAAALVTPTLAFAGDDPPVGIFYFNDGNGTCGYYQETPYGPQVIDTFPCPREVGGG
jgi:hypothetical protein